MPQMGVTAAGAPQDLLQRDCLFVVGSVMLDLDLLPLGSSGHNPLNFMFGFKMQ